MPNRTYLFTMNHSLRLNASVANARSAMLIAGLLFGLSPVHLRGQSIVRFDEPGASWQVAHSFPNGSMQNPGFVATTTLLYFLDGDTLIGNSLWQRMFATPTWAEAPVPSYLGVTRQEGPFVLFQDSTGMVDTLYNFALQVGDSMGFGLPGSGYTDSLRVDSIGQVLVQGVPHKVFHFSLSTVYYTLESYLSDTWIEGIGSVHGPLAPGSLFDLEDSYSSGIPDSTRLTCYNQGTNTLWQHSGYTDCEVNLLLSVNGLGPAQLRVWPNPVDSRLQVTLPTATRSAIHLLDATGRTVLHRTTCGMQATLDLGPLPPGPYLLVVAPAEGAETRVKVIVE